MFKPSSELRNLQLKCVEILDVIHKICIDNDIEYSLCGGSVIGAYLYSGFLPWDDDVDLMMTRTNYNKFLKVCKKSLPDGYRLQNYHTSKDYTVLFSKIMDENTTFIQKGIDEKNIVSGVFVDITVYDKVPLGNLNSINILLWKICMWIFYGIKEPNSILIKKQLQNIAISILGNRPTWLFKLTQFIIELLGNTDKYAYSELFGAFCNTKKYNAHIFENYSTIIFENKEYMIVRNYKDYLEKRYDRTNYEVPENEQIPSHYVYVDLKQSYVNYGD